MKPNDYILTRRKGKLLAIHKQVLRYTRRKARERKAKSLLAAIAAPRNLK